MSVCKPAKLDVANLLNLYLVRPFDASSEQDRMIALLASICLIFPTVGLLHLYCAVRQRNLRVIDGGAIFGGEGKKLVDISAVAAEAEKGDAQAQLQFAVLCQRGKAGGPDAEANALYWSGLSAKQGNKRAKQLYRQLTPLKNDPLCVSSDEEAVKSETDRREDSDTAASDGEYSNNSSPEGITRAQWKTMGGKERAKLLATRQSPLEQPLSIRKSSLGDEDLADGDFVGPQPWVVVQEEGDTVVEGQEHWVATPVPSPIPSDSEQQPGALKQGDTLVSEDETAGFGEEIDI